MFNKDKRDNQNSADSKRLNSMKIMCGKNKKNSRSNHNLKYSA